MKNLFKINEDEKSRILFLHENFGKKEILTEADMTDNDLLGSTNVFRNYIQLVSDFDVLYGPLGINPANILGGRRVGVKGVVDALDGFVDSKDLGYVLKVINGLKGRCYLDDSKIPAVRVSAMKRFLELYKEDEGEDLIADVQSVGTVTLPTGSEKVKTQIINTIKSYSATVCSAAKAKGGVNKAAVKTAGGKTAGGGKTSSGGGGNITPRIQAAQKKLGIQNGTGQLDVASLQTMLSKLNGGTPAAGAPVQSVGAPAAAGLASTQQQMGMTTDQLNNTIKQLQANANRPV